MEVKRRSILVECRGAVVVDILWSTAFTIILFVMTLGLAMEIVITNVERTQPFINAPPPYGGPRTYISVSANALVDF